jgi:hypothetical protein
MAIRQVTGGVPVYSIEVDVPKPTDSRGKGYGSLVSDLRWKLWQEVQESQLQQMKFEQLTKQAQLDVLEQQQRDVSRAIRDANEQKARIKAGTATAGTAPKALGSVTVKEEPARNLLGRPIPGAPPIVTRTVRTPTNIVRGAGVDAEKALEQQQAQFEQQRADLDAYIAELEAQQTQLGTRFQALASQPVGRDILSRTREAFQSQIGEGGFGISRRPLRQLPRFDELQAVGLLDDAIANAEGEIMAEAARLFPQGISLQAEQDLKRRAREELARKIEGAGAEPTSRAGFLMKPPPPYEGLLPREETRFPTGRVRDDFGVTGAAPLSREQEVLRDINRGADVYPELQDIRAVREATARPAETPLEQTARRNVEMEALGVPYDVNYPPTIEDAAAIENQRKLDEARMARDRGFETPVQDISGFRQGVTGRPGGMADRRVVNRLLRQSETPGGLSGAPSIEPTPAQPKPSVGNAEDLKFMGEFFEPGTETPLPIPAPGPEIVPEEPETPLEEKKLRTRARPELPPMDNRLPESSTEPQGKLTVPQRREIYAMNTIKRGLELAEKPKQFARVAKTDNPSTAAEYVRLVNGVYELNSARPDRFKASFDEIARVYKNDPKNRELALSYLVAKDAIESNVTKPMA